MAVLPIRIYPDPVLRVDCPPVESFDGELADLARDMVETMHRAPGVGLAAPQVGVERQICVVDVTVGEAPEALHVLVNPEVSLREGLDIDVEGCLSIPDFSDKVPRPVRIEVSFQSLEGERLQLEAEGFLARAICHEIDHLHGILFVDHLRGLRKERAKRHLKRLGREAEVVT
jgi:peptide deformylase